MVGYQGWLVLNIYKSYYQKHIFQFANSAVMGLLHFSVPAVLIVTGSKSDLCVCFWSLDHIFNFFVRLSKSVPAGTHQLTNNSRLIQIIEDIQLTHELLKGRDGGRDGCDGVTGVYQDLLEHLD